MKKIKLLFKFAALAACMSFLSANAAEIPYLPVLADINGTTVDLQTFALPTTDFTLDIVAADQSVVTVCGIYSYTQGANTARIARRGINFYLYDGNNYVRILEKSSVQVEGITGATSATILTGSAYAPNVVLGAGDVWDVSFSVLENPEFSVNASGWTSTTGASNIQKQTDADLDVPGVFGNGFYENWKSTAFTGKMYATAKNFPFANGGKYTLKMGVHLNTVSDGVWMYANEDEVKVSLAVVGTPETQTLENFTLVGSEMEVGLNLKDSMNNWVALDNVTILYLGTATDTELKAALDKRVETAEVYLLEKMESAVLAKLNSRISDANAATATQAMNDAADSIRTVLVEVKASIAEYVKLKDAIQAANDTVNGRPGLSGETALRAVIANAQSQYDNGALDAAGIEAQIQALNDAVAAWLLTQDAPYDISFMFTNLDFEISGLSGWTNNGMQTQTNTEFALKSGNTYAEKWVSAGSVDAPGALADASVTQTVSNLPNGVYEITVAAHAKQQLQDAETPNTITYTKGAILFVNDNQVQVDAGDLDAKDYVISGVVVDGTLTFGFKTVSTDANWVACDNFRIRYTGFDVNTVLDALKALIQKASPYTSNKDMQNTVLAELNAAIDAATTVAFDTPVGNLTEEMIENAASRLTAALNAALESIDAYATFLIAIESAQAVLESMPSNPGADDFETVINDMYDQYGDLELDVEGIEEQLAILAQAEANFKFKQIVPFDATFTILNPSFEKSSTLVETRVNRPDDWSMEYSLSGPDVTVVTSAADQPVDGGKIFNAWSESFTSMDIYQYITLPAGKYKLTASMRTEKLEQVTDQRIYVVADGETSYSNVIEHYTTSHTEEEIVDKTWRDFWDFVTVEFEVETRGTVRVGASSTGDGGTIQANGWFQLDNYKLTCLEVTDVSSVDIPSVEKPVVAFNVQGGIIINGNIGERVNIYSVTGQLLKTQLVDGSIITLNQGMYIVSIGNTTQKVIVK